MTPAAIPERNGGQILVQQLRIHGARRVFMIPGESYLPCIDALNEHIGTIEPIVCRQESGAAYMAEAYGKLTGEPGICFVTRSPGATNASIGVHTAFQDSTPMVLFVGDVAGDQRDREAFQELEYTSFFGPSTKGMAKRVERIDDPDRVPEAVARAFATAMNGRPGPVVLVLPEDMLVRSTAARPLARVEPVQAWSDPGALRQLRELVGLEGLDVGGAGNGVEQARGRRGGGIVHQEGREVRPRARFQIWQRQRRPSAASRPRGCPPTSKRA